MVSTIHIQRTPSMSESLEIFRKAETYRHELWLEVNSHGRIRSLTHYRRYGISFLRQNERLNTQSAAH